MSKIICDVCGTAYPETAEQCPICGCARPADAIAVTSLDTEADAATSGYSQVRGGRFSKKNVRKRNMTAKAAKEPREEKAPKAPKASKPPKAAKPAEPKPSAAHDRQSREEQSNRGLVILALVLFLAIICVVAFVAIRYFAPDLLDFSKETTTAPVSTTTTAPPVIDDGKIPCTGLTMTDESITLDQEGAQWRLNVATIPENTTDTITYASSDEAVVTVSSTGTLTAVGNGRAVITITCGDQTTSCTVLCDFAEETIPPETTLPPETTPPETTVPPTTQPVKKTYTMLVNGEKRKTYDVTIKVGNSFTLTIVDENGETADVTWKNSGPSYVKVSGNKVTGTKAVSYVTLTATVDGEEFKCVVRVNK